MSQGSGLAGKTTAGNLAPHVASTFETRKFGGESVRIGDLPTCQPRAYGE